MTKQDIARVCLAAVVAGFSAVAVTKAGIDSPNGVARGLVFCVVAGIVMNSPTGMQLRHVILGAACVAFAFIVSLLWIALLGGGIFTVSGVKIDMHSNQAYAASVLGGAFFLSLCGVAVASVARPATLGALEKLGDMEVSKAKNVEAFINVAASICGAAALFLL